MSINEISKIITSRIARELSLSNEKQAVIQYGLINLLSQLLTVILLLIVALFFRMLNEVVIIGLSNAALRRYSGGAHCSSPLRCSLLSIAVVPILVFLAKFIYNLYPITCIMVVVLINLVSIFIYFVYAPQDTPAKPIKNIKKIKSLKLKSVFLSIFFFLISTSLFYFGYELISILLTLGSFNQSLTLTWIGKFYVSISDRILKIVTP